MSFATDMIAAMKPRITVPEPIVAYLEWVEASGLMRTYATGPTYALVDPSMETSCVGLGLPDPDHACLWVGKSTPEVKERLKPFCRTGGDGSHAAFWVNDTGDTQIVHMGSGSGSTMTGVMVSDPVDFLRLLAIGYAELCWPEAHAMTPQELHEEEYPSEDYEGMEEERPQPPAKPEALPKWLQATFAVSVPDKASAILGELPDMHDEGSSDPFMVWLAKVDA